METTPTPSDPWSPLIGALAAILAVWLVSRFSGGPLTLLKAKSFPELSGRGEEEQKRLLGEASALASKSRTSILPLLVLPLFFGIGLAIASLIRAEIPTLDSPWVSGSICGLFAALGTWLSTRLNEHMARPYLQKCLRTAASADNSL